MILTAATLQPGDVLCYPSANLICSHLMLAKRGGISIGVRAREAFLSATQLKAILAVLCLISPEHIGSMLRGKGAWHASVR